MSTCVHIHSLVLFSLSVYIALTHFMLMFKYVHPSTKDGFRPHLGNKWMKKKRTSLPQLQEVDCYVIKEPSRVAM